MSALLQSTACRAADPASQVWWPQPTRLHPLADGCPPELHAHSPEWVQTLPRKHAGGAEAGQVPTRPECPRGRAREWTQGCRRCLTALMAKLFLRWQMAALLSCSHLHAGRAEAGQRPPGADLGAGPGAQGAGGRHAGRARGAVRDQAGRVRPHDTLLLCPSMHSSGTPRLLLRPGDWQQVPLTTLPPDRKQAAGKGVRRGTLQGMLQGAGVVSDLPLALPRLKLQRDVASMEKLKGWSRVRDDPVGKLALLQQAQQLAVVAAPNELQVPAPALLIPPDCVQPRPLGPSCVLLPELHARGSLVQDFHRSVCAAPGPSRGPLPELHAVRVLHRAGCGAHVVGEPHASKPCLTPGRHLTLPCRAP